MTDRTTRPEPSARPLARSIGQGAGPLRPGGLRSATTPGGAGPGQRRLVLAIILLLALAAAAALYWFETRNLESTDDAFIDGDYVQIVPRVAGPVVALRISDNQAVRKGDLLLEIDRRDYQVAVDSAAATLAAAAVQALMARANLELTRASTAAMLVQAESGVAQARAAIAQGEAQVAGAEAEQVRARQDAVRYRRLVRDDIASRQRVEEAEAQTRKSDAQWRAAKQAVKAAQAQLGEAQGRLLQAKTGPQQIAVREAELRLAEARVTEARAALDQAKLNLSYTRILAPHDGFITKRAVREGDVVQKDQVLGAIVFGAPWVTANFKETQLTRMRPGQPVTITVDAFPGRTLKGHVDSIQRGTGARFSLLPPENATGNFVKVVQRVPVKITLDEPAPAGYAAGLGLGMSVEPTVDLGAALRETAE